MMYRHLACQTCKVPDLINWMVHGMIWSEVELGTVGAEAALAAPDGKVWDETQEAPLGEPLRKCMWDCLPDALRPLLFNGMKMPNNMIDRCCDGYDISTVTRVHMLEWLENIGFPQVVGGPPMPKEWDSDEEDEGEESDDGRVAVPGWRASGGCQSI
jgi:hypothetical protein